MVKPGPTTPMTPVMDGPTRRGPTTPEETDMKDRLQLRAYRLAFAVSTVMALATSLGAPRKFG